MVQLVGPTRWCNMLVQHSIVNLHPQVQMWQSTTSNKLWAFKDSLGIPCEFLGIPWKILNCLEKPNYVIVLRLAIPLLPISESFFFSFGAKVNYFCCSVAILFIFIPFPEARIPEFSESWKFKRTRNSKFPSFFFFFFFFFFREK